MNMNKDTAEHFVVKNFPVRIIDMYGVIPRPSFSETKKWLDL